MFVKHFNAPLSRISPFTVFMNVSVLLFQISVNSRSVLTMNRVFIMNESSVLLHDYIMPIDILKIFKAFTFSEKQAFVGATCSFQSSSFSSGC